MKTLIFLFLVVFQLGLTDPPNARREALNFLTSLHKRYSMHDASILHPDFQAVLNNGTILSRENTVHYINNLNAEKVKHHKNLTIKYSEATIEDNDVVWRHQHHIARFTEDQNLEVEKYKHQVLKSKVVGKPDATMEGGYKFYRFYIY